MALLFAWKPWAAEEEPTATHTPTLPAVVEATEEHVETPPPTDVFPTAELTRAPDEPTKGPVTKEPSTEEPPTPVPTPTPTPLPPTTTPTPTRSLAKIEAEYVRRLPYSRPNGEPFFAYLAAAPIRVDGRLSEWDPMRYPIDQDPVDNTPYDLERWSGYSDLSGRMQLAWDRDYLYLGVEVTDDVHAQIETGATLYRGDGGEIQFDANLGGDFNDTAFGSDDFHIGISPGDFGRLAPEAYLWTPGDRREPSILVAASPTGNGYELEIALPWRVLGVTPADGSAFGFCFCLYDNDQRGAAEHETILCPLASRRWHVPPSLGTLVLAVK